METFREFLLREAAYAGNLGIMELIKFQKVATPKEKAVMKKLVARNKENVAWELLKKVTQVKLK